MDDAVTISSGGPAGPQRSTKPKPCRVAGA
jgi:hypothetical protein